MSSLCGYRKCLSWRTSRRVVQLLLVAWFLAQCVVSLNKLLERDVGTAESSDHEENPAYPSLTLCPLSSSYDPSVNDGRTLDEAYESLIPIANRLVFLEQENFSDSENVHINGSNIKDYTEKEIVSEIIATANERLINCLMYNPPGRSVVGIPGTIDVRTNWNGADAYAVFLHNKDMFNPSLAKPYGSTYTIVSSRNNMSELVEESFEIDRTKWTLVNTNKAPCSDASYNIVNCMHRSTEKELNCKLPWTKFRKGSRIPNVTCELDKTESKLHEFVGMDEHHIGLKYGCVGSCERFSYRLGRINHSRRVPQPGEEVMLRLFFTITTGSFRVKKQYIIYDLSSLISDIGGYLGLLLGQSLLTSYDIFLNWVTNKK